MRGILSAGNWKILYSTPGRSIAKAQTVRVENIRIRSAFIGLDPRQEQVYLLGGFRDADVGQPIMAAAGFQAAPRSTIETDLVVAKPRLLPRSKRPPERRLQP